MLFFITFLCKQFSWYGFCTLLDPDPTPLCESRSKSLPKMQIQIHISDLFRLGQNRLESKLDLTKTLARFLRAQVYVFKMLTLLDFFFLSSSKRNVTKWHVSLAITYYLENTKNYLCLLFFIFCLLKNHYNYLSRYSSIKSTKLRLWFLFV